LSRRQLAILRELVAWRDIAAAALDRATFRVIGNETLLEISRVAPVSLDALSPLKGVPRGWSPQRLGEVLAAVQRGLAAGEDDLPRFPRAHRWDRDPHFDERFNALRTARDDVAAKLDLDSGVLGSRERLEAVARKMPKNMEELEAIPELRRWQISAMGSEMLRAINKK
jgi:ribonuclease D